jgi:hypothetical protein
MSDDQQQLLAAEAKRRVSLALRQIEDAQNALGHACSTLSSLDYACPMWKATSKLYDRVHAHWYKVRDRLEGNTKVKLDGTNAEAFLKK